MTYSAQGLSVFHSVGGSSRLVVSMPDATTAQRFADVLNSEHGQHVPPKNKQAVTVSVRCVYGVERVYPADNAAVLFAALLNVKTFNATQISAIRALGYAVHVAAGQLPREMQPATF